MFAIGVASLFGAACGAMGILIARIRRMKAELRELETRLDEAADRNWEIREAQERTASFLEAQDDANHVVRMPLMIRLLHRRGDLVVRLGNHVRWFDCL